MEENSIAIDNSREALDERYELCIERINNFPESLSDQALRDYFERIKEITLICDSLRKGAERNAEINHLLYDELSAEHFEESFMNPDFCQKRLGDEKCGILCVWFREFRGIIPFSFEDRLSDICAILETTIQIYNTIEEEQVNVGMMQEMIMNEHITDTVYCYLYDYAEEFTEDYLRRDLCDTNSFAKNIVMNADLTNVGEDSYLYSFGEWITAEQLGTARLMASLSDEKIEKMARAYTDGYIRGFKLTGKDITKKSTVSCFLPLGFERFMREAIKQFEAAGLSVIINRNPVHLINKRLRGNIRPGFYGAFNLQCEYDHNEDMCLFWGTKLMEHKLQALKNACEKHREELGRLSGRACVEIFGVKAEEMINKKSLMHFSAHQIKVNNDYIFKSHEINKEYIPDEETSFTIIAWPTPSIAENMSSGFSDDELYENYAEIFDSVIDINTLSADKWQNIQQHIIDALDKADHVEIKGCGANTTAISVKLHELKEPEKETNFENCLSDVNVPAGEVFTSPVLKGTNGVLNVGYVYIGGYLFRNLRLRFVNGRVTDYACDNFFDPAEGRKLISKVIFGDREKLPMGEFAIGTNTKAYAAARKYMIEDKLPVLIAEKTGPHFAVGDTCYSYEEDIETFNPDGKKITARENEVSALRKTDPENAYFGVHCDITIPYDELGSITAVSGKERIDIIRDGKFVLPGTEELNDALSVII